MTMVRDRIGYELGSSILLSDEDGENESIHYFESCYFIFLSKHEEHFHREIN
jgi:hypothetical protein